MKDGNQNGIFVVEKCRGKGACPNALLDTGELAEQITQILNQFDSALGESKMLLYHQISRIAIAGCPNACSQPQIKDIGIIGKVQLEFQPELCSQCGICIETCKENALLSAAGTPVLLNSNCIGCGECIRVCPSGAFQGREVGLQIAVGGKLGRHPKLAEEIFSFTDAKRASELLTAIHKYLHSRFSGKVERLSTILEEQGIADFKQSCCKN